MKKVRWFQGLAVGLVVLSALGLAMFAGHGLRAGKAARTASPALASNVQGGLIRLPLTFVENQGQWDSPARFVAQKGNMAVRFEKDAFTLQMENRDGDRVKGVAVRMAFEGASEKATLEGEGKQEGRYNYFLGNDRTKWKTDVPGYSSAMYKNLYDGVDLRVREQEGRLEYDVLLAPGADLSQVAIRCEGVQKLALGKDGSLVMETALGPITQKPPATWYVLPSGERKQAQARYRVMDGKRYGFEVPDLEPELALVIDPGLVWSTFLGGNNNDWPGFGRPILPDSAGVTVCGKTYSSNFPRTPGAYDTSYNGGADGFVARLSADGSSLIWATFLGGSGDDWAFSIVQDPSGALAMTGQTASVNFPTTSGAFDTSYNGNIDAFVARLSSTGSSLLFSTFLGGSGVETFGAINISVDNSGSITVGGATASNNFPVTPGAFDTSYNGAGGYGYGDAFVTRLNPTGSALVWSTYLGGSDDDFVEPMTLLGSGDVIVGGGTFSSNFPTTPGAYDTSFNGVEDAYFARLNSTGSALVWSTFLGGSGMEKGSFALDASGNIINGCWTQSSNFPVTPGAYDTSFNGVQDAVICRLSSDGSTLLWSTFLGGSGQDGGNCVAVQSNGDVTLAGYTYSSNFPTTSGAYDTTFNGSVDVVVCRLNSTGSALLYSTFLGGSANEAAWAMTLDNQGMAVVEGWTLSRNFPVTPNAYDTSWNGGSQVGDVFVSKIDLVPLGVEQGPPSVSGPSLTVALGPPLPNPTRGPVSYTVTLSREAKVQVRLYDLTGRLVQSLVDQKLPAGVSRFSWSGSKAPSGAYLLRLDAEGVHQTRKLVLVR